MAKEGAPSGIPTPTPRMVVGGYESSAVAALALFEMSALPALVCGALLASAALILTLPMRGVLLDWHLIGSGLFFAVMRQSSTVLLQAFSLLVHSLIKVSRRFFFIFLALWLAHQRPSALHVTGLALVLCGATSMDMCSRFPKQWWVLLSSLAVTALVAAATYALWSGHWGIA